MTSLYTLKSHRIDRPPDNPSTLTAEKCSIDHDGRPQTEPNRSPNLSRKTGRRTTKQASITHHRYQTHHRQDSTTKETSNQPSHINPPNPKPTPLDQRDRTKQRKKRCASKSTTCSPAATTMPPTRHPTRSSNAFTLPCRAARRSTGTAPTSRESTSCSRMALGPLIMITTRSVRSVESWRMRG
jgi:hypothetical protein